MNVYKEITSNKIRTFFIFLIFIFIFSGFFYLLGEVTKSRTEYFLFGLIFSTISVLISYFYSDKIILFSVNAKPANKKEHFDFYTVAENLSIASGLPMPKLYVINDLALNAFATGRSPNHSVICITTGLLQKLERSELEGVIAHELSHIKNYDVLLASVVSILVGTISLISDWLLRTFWWKREDDRRKTNPYLFFIYILALIITPLVATLIQLAISRRREYLADASAVLLTRYPEGLARALEKIANDNYILRNVTPATAHLFIVNPLEKNKFLRWLSNLFSTHPPIEERIKILRKM